MRTGIPLIILIAAAALAEEKITFDDRVEIVRGLSAEFHAQGLSAEVEKATTLRVDRRYDAKR
jgi:hypothetical protein